MLRKKCRVCNKSSYSASDHGLWLCPYCNTDLTEEKTMVANDSEPAWVQDQSIIESLLQSEIQKRKRSTD